MNGERPQPTIHQIQQAIRWRLGLPHDMAIPDCEILWQRLYDDRAGRDLIRATFQQLGGLLSDSLLRKVEMKPDKWGYALEVDDGLAKALLNWLKQEGQSQRRLLKLSGLVDEALKQQQAKRRLAAAATRSAQEAAISQAAGGAVPAPGSLVPAGATGQSAHDSLPPPRNAYRVSLPLEETTTPPAAPNPAPAPAAVEEPPAVVPRWRDQEIPEGPDKHLPSDKLIKIDQGLKLIGARVRGRKHKHEGTNCDDWFAFEICKPWTIIAVSDGAGSKPLSRVGARVACEGAVEFLRLHLGGIQPRASGSREELLKRGDDGRFLADELATAQDALFAAIEEAYRKIVAAAEQRNKDGSYMEALGGRQIAPDDLAATLLLVVHTEVIVAGKPLSLVLSCQIGDGGIGLIDDKGQVVLLGVADSGEFAGETEFLTSPDKLAPAALAAKTREYLNPLRALMVMTDGVADDYFPMQSHLLRLYADLVLNRIILMPMPEPAAAIAALEGTKLPSAAAVGDAKYAYPKQDAPEIQIRTAELFAEQLGVPLDRVLGDLALLAVGSKIKGDEPLQEFTVDERLRAWLDAYHVRGSFDDRTLVVLHREVNA